jgi:hypothetical protein
MNDVEYELATAEDLELEFVLHELVRVDAERTPSPHFKRRLVLACFRVR